MTIQAAAKTVTADDADDHVARQRKAGALDQRHVFPPLIERPPCRRCRKPRQGAQVHRAALHGGDEREGSSIRKPTWKARTTWLGRFTTWAAEPI
jgi:hypothetical protein